MINEMNTNHKHQADFSCDFAETLVAVLYGEASPGEQQAFERHIVDCRSCRAESAAFGMVRSSLGEWRETVFANLETPEIVLPAPPKVVHRQIEKSGWLAALRDFLQPSGNIWQSSAGVYAAITICAALLAVFGYNFVNQSNNNSVVVSPVAVNTPLPSPGAASVKDLDNEVAVVPPQERKENRNNIAPTPPSKRLPAQRPASEAERKPASKQRTVPRKSKTEDDALPLDEMDDDSIRLADLFDEISSTD